jgi:C1A family cysteine protease
MPEVWQQGDLGSCTAFSTCAAFQYEVARQGKQAYYPSFLAQYWWARYLDGPDNTRADVGATLRSAVKASARWGVAHDSTWPYLPAKFARQPTKRATQDAERHQVLRYVAVPQDVTQMRACLAGGWPIIVGISVYESFEGGDVAASGRVPMPRPGERVLGGHAVLVVGYDWSTAGYDPSGYDPRFVCRNSWGKDWGDGGYFTIPAQYLNDPGLSGDFWSLRLVET